MPRNARCRASARPWTWWRARPTQSLPACGRLCRRWHGGHAARTTGQDRTPRSRASARWTFHMRRTCMHHSAEYHDNGHGNGFMLGLMAGAAIGAGVALLFAPREGSQIRRDLSHRAHRLGEQLNRSSETVKETVRHAADTANDLINRGRSAYQDAAEHAREAAGKMDDSVQQAATSAQQSVNRAAGATQNAAERAGAAQRAVNNPL